MKQALMYSLKVWLTVTVLVPLTIDTINLIYERIKRVLTVRDVVAALKHLMVTCAFRFHDSLGFL
jgi:hypothetical protein